MYTYICENCDGEQYSASSEKENEKCIYCKNENIKFVGVTEFTKSDKAELNKREQEQENDIEPWRRGGRL